MGFNKAYLQLTSRKLYSSKKTTKKCFHPLGFLNFGYPSLLQAKNHLGCVSHYHNPQYSYSCVQIYRDFKIIFLSSSQSPSPHVKGELLPSPFSSLFSITIKITKKDSILFLPFPYLNSKQPEISSSSLPFRVPSLHFFCDYISIPPLGLLNVTFFESLNSSIDDIPLNFNFSSSFHSNHINQIKVKVF